MGTMFNPAQIVIDQYVERLRDNYTSIYGLLEPEFPGIIGFVGRLALENIANTDTPYHDLHHTILVTDVGQEILRGRHLSEGGVSPRDWLHFVVSLLCHDIGYVRGVCRDDGDHRYVMDFEGNTTEIARGATDASLTPYHVTRSKLFVEERFGKVPQISAQVIHANIEHTRFPVPADEDHADTAAYPGFLRAADLIGQMADVNYPRKISALFREFQETGTAQALGYETAADLMEAYPKFFWGVVSPLITEALFYLRKTQIGKMWVNSLYANVFAQEHRLDTYGPERNT